MLCQQKHVLDLLSETGKLGVKQCSTPKVQIAKETYLKTLRNTEDWLRN